MSAEAEPSVLRRGPLDLGATTPQLLICDLDNTLYDFATYYESALERSVPIASKRLGIPVAEVLRQLRAVFIAHNSIEYPYAFYEMESAQTLDVGVRIAFSSELMESFWKGGLDGLRTYFGVEDTLSYLVRNRIAVAAFTDAPIHEAMRRLRALQLDRFILGLVATDWFKPASTLGGRPNLQSLPGHTQIPKRFRVRGRLQDIHRKPSSSTYLAIAKAFGVEPERVMVVGDSPGRDLAPAAQVGMEAIWARYGKREIDREELLLQVVPHRLPEVSGARSQAAQPAFKAIDTFGDIVELMCIQQRFSIPPQS